MTGLRSTPMLLISTSTISPVSIGPTPSQVPVYMTSPGYRVTCWLIKLMHVGTSKISISVPECCLTCPLRRVSSVSLEGSVIAVSIQGPRGENVSQDLPRHHCKSPRCHGRAVTSLPQV